MEKFDKWNDEKKIIHQKDCSEVYVNIREIWYIKMWVNIWFEENGKTEFLRPVLVVKKVWNLFFTVALTSQWKDNNYFYYKFKDLELSEKNKKYINSSYAILSQVKTVDKKRFTQNVWIISKQDFTNLQKSLKICYFKLNLFYLLNN